MKSNKAEGPDQVPIRVLQAAVDILSHPLKVIFTKSLEYSVVPQDWRDANVTPIFKKGAKDQPGNYRPVSLTSVVCKIFEKVIKNKLSNHLIEQKLLSPHQFGFIPGRNTNTQLLVSIKEWQRNLDDSIPTDVVDLGFREAFDTVPHKRLLYKLSKYGIKGNLLSWIKDFLSNRTQYVKIR